MPPTAWPARSNSWAAAAPCITPAPACRSSAARARRRSTAVWASSCKARSSPVTLQYETNWAGNLVIASSGRSAARSTSSGAAASVSVAPRLTIDVQPYSTVNISNDNSSTLVMSTAPDTTYGFLTAGTAGPPAARAQQRAFGRRQLGGHRQQRHVQRQQRPAGLGAITGNGTFNVTNSPLAGQNATVASVPSLVQGTASVASSATLNITGPAQPRRAW